MKNQGFSVPARGRPAEKAPKAAAPVATKHGPLRRWSVAELIRQAALPRHPTTAPTPCA